MVILFSFMQLEPDLLPMHCSCVGVIILKSDMLRYIVKQPSALIDFLIQAIPAKRSSVKKLLQSHCIQVNNSVITKATHLLQAGDNVIYDKQTLSLKKIPYQGLIHPIFEVEYIIVVDKPAGILTIGTEKEKIYTLYSELNEYLRFKYSDKKLYAYSVPRLDRETSGLILFAKSKEIKTTMMNNWKQFTKKYLAIVEGKFHPSSGSIISYLKENPFLKMQSVPEHQHSKRSVTHFKCINANENFSLLEITLETGRKNQIRAHLSEKGFPIIGDKKYGSNINNMKRIGLHAHHLQFIHPATQKTITLNSPLPNDLKRFIQVLS